MASECTGEQQAFAGAYVLLSSLFLLSVVYESGKLLYRYHLPDSFKSPTYLLYASMLFVFISTISLIKCIMYGIWRCNFGAVHPFNMSIINNLSQDLYVVQLYVLWLVLMMRLHSTFKETPFELTKLTIQMYSVTFLLVPFTCFLWISASTYSLFVVISYSLSIFITLSIVILFCYKLVQLNRYKDWHATKQYKEYTRMHGLDLLTLITKHSILVLIATMFSFAILLILITIFVLNVYDVSLIGQQQLLDLCLLFDTYITTCCVLFQFAHLHRKYEFCCSCVDATCKTICRKYFGISLNISQEIQLTNIMEEKEAALLHAPHALSNQGSHSTYHEAVGSASLNNITPQQLQSYEIESELGSQIPDIPENQTIDDMLRKLHAQEHAKQRAAHPQHYKQQTIPQNIYTNITPNAIQYLLIKRGFDKLFTNRAVGLYQNHYGKKVYDLKIIEEIIYRLTVKDKLKQLKAVKNLYQSRVSVLDILSSLNFSLRYINLAMMLYEVMAEMFEIGKQHDSIYDLELITELIMRLRSKFTEYGDALDSGVYINCNDADGATMEETQTSTMVEEQFIEHKGHRAQNTMTTDRNQQFVDIVNHRMMSMSPDGFVNTNLMMQNAQTVSVDAVSAAAPSSTHGGIDGLDEDEEEEDSELQLMDPEVHYNTVDIPGEAPQDNNDSHRYHVKVSSGIHEAESIEIDPTPLGRPNSGQSGMFDGVGQKSSSRVLQTIPEKQRRPRPQAPKHKDYNVIIDFINTPQANPHRPPINARFSSTGEPIRMEDSDDSSSVETDDDYEDEKTDVLSAMHGERTHHTQGSWVMQQTFSHRMTSLRVESPPIEAMTYANYKAANDALNAKRFVENEIIETERTYVEGLHILYDEFITTIFEEQLLHNRYRKQVTSIIPQLITFHEQFYEELRTAASIANVFVKQSDFFKMYIAYVTQYNKLLDIFGNSQRNKKLHQFLEDKRLHENKVLVSFLIIPIQRIPRYMLLLSELKKNTSVHDGFEYRDIENALNRVELICGEINEKQREIENMSHALLVSNKLKGLAINIVEPQRKYCGHFIFREKKKKHKNRQFFLFSDIVIIADMKWRIQQVIELINFEAKRPKSNEVKIRIIEETGSPTGGSPITPLNNGATVIYVVADDIAQKDAHPNVSDPEMFCKMVNKYRSKLRSYVHVNQNNNHNNYNHNVNPSGSPSSEQMDVFREEHEKDQFAKWQKSNSKGNKVKVAKMLKSSSEAFFD